MDKITENNIDMLQENITIEDFCHELQCMFKEFFICELKRDNNVFDIEFRDGSKFRLTVEEQK